VLVAAVAVGAWLGPFGGSDGDGGDDLVVATADMVVPQGNVVGSATLWDRSPPVMEVDVRDWLDRVEQHGGSLDDQWWLSVESDDGSMRMYEVQLTRSQPSAITLRSDSGEVVAVGLVDEDGRTWCSGRFST
jgi:hypothetical protein